MATYVNNLRLKEITTGDEDGTWGTSTNTNLELIGEALGYNTQDGFSSDANATTTVADGATDPARALYFKVTSSATLTATRTLTIAPNTVSRLMWIENATTGSQTITIKQGSGATVNVPTGETKIVYLDGAGAGAAVVDALVKVAQAASGTVTSVSGTGTVNGITLTGTVTSSGNLTLGGTLGSVDLTSQITGTLPVGNGGTGITSLGSGVATWMGTPSSANLASAVTDETGTGALVFGTAPTLTGLTLAGAVTGADQTVSAVNLKDYGEVTNAIGSTGGGTQDIDLTLGNSVTATVDTSANTFTFSNPTASDELCGFTLTLTNGGSQTVNWPASVDWAGGTAPTLTASGVDVLVFYTTDGGTRWYGFLAGANLS